MKGIICGDFHGATKEDIGRLKGLILDITPDIVISLGDFDQVETITSFIREIKKDERYHTIDVPGNHDWAIFNDVKINSGTLTMQGKTSHQLHEELFREPFAENYIRELLKGNDEKRLHLGEGYQAVVIHGAYEGGLSSCPNCPPELNGLWTRLRTEEDYRKNFAKMRLLRNNVMIRGHDHEPKYVVRTEGGIEVHKPKYKGEEFKMPRYAEQVITPGAFYDYFVASIDTEPKEGELAILTFYQLD